MAMTARVFASSAGTHWATHSAPTSPVPRAAVPPSRVPVRCASRGTGDGRDLTRVGMTSCDDTKASSARTRARAGNTPGGATADGGNAAVKPKNKNATTRRNKNRRRGPKKTDPTPVDRVDVPSVRKPPSDAAVALASAASVDGGAAVARFMGTFDESDGGAEADEIQKGFASVVEYEAYEETLADESEGSFARPPDTEPRFMGTIDDGDMDMDLFLRKGKDEVGKKKKKPVAVTDLATAPTDGNPNLAFLYHAAAIEWISRMARGSGDTDIFGNQGDTSGSVDTDPDTSESNDTPTSTAKPDVNHPAVVGRCNDAIRKCGSMDDVLALVREMTNAGVVPVESTYVAIMLVCRDTSVGPARAIEVYDAMKLVGVPTTKRAFDLVMSCAIRARKPEEALRLKHELALSAPVDGKANPVQMDPRTWTSLLKLVSECDFGKKRGPKQRLIKTCKLFEEMLASGGGDTKTQPPPAAFNVLIVAAAKARQPDLVARTFEEMKLNGISPSRETYETTLAAVSAGGLVDFALDVFSDMRKDGFAPRKTTYNSLLEACAKSSQPRVEQAFEIFHRMSEEGRIAPNARTFALLIDAASRAGLPRFAFDAFDAMRAAGVEVSLVTYNRLIRAAGGDGETTGAAALDASGGVKTARALLAEIVNNTQLEPDVYTYGSVLGTCAAAALAGDANAASVAKQTAGEMLAAGVPHNRATRHALIAALGRAGRWREALGEYTQMRQVVIQGAEAHDKAHLASEQFAEFGNPGRETYGVVFDALLSVGGAEAAIAAVALEPGGGEFFIRGPRAACARAVFRDGVEAGVFDDPKVRLNAASCDEGDAAPMRVNHNHLTRSEAVVATLFLLETFAENSSTPYSVGNTPPPAGLFIGEGPGTKGNAQRRTLAVESVLRAASVPCGTMEDPSAYVVGVTSSGLRAWIARSPAFRVLELGDPELGKVLETYVAEETLAASS